MLTSHLSCCSDFTFASDFSIIIHSGLVKDPSESGIKILHNTVGLPSFSKMNGFQATSKFAIKAYLKYKAFTVLVIGLGVSILVFGLGVRLFEKYF